MTTQAAQVAGDAGGRAWRLAVRLGLVAAALWLLGWSAQGVRIDLERISRGLPSIGRIVALMYPFNQQGYPGWLLAGLGAGAAAVGAFEMGRLRRLPVGGLAVGVVFAALAFTDGEWLGESLKAMGQSFAIAVLGTTIGAVLAVPLGFWAARNMVVYRVLAALGRQLLNAIRTFPEIILAIFFVAAYGPGPLPGVMAVGLHSVGMLGKLYADIVENMDRGPIEALTACGANRPQLLRLAVMPQVLPEFAATALYRLEINMRSATTLGLVGAGGIGVILLQALQFRRWPVVGTALLVIVVAVTLIDYGSAWLRRRLV